MNPNGFFQIGTIVEQGQDGFDPETPGAGYVCVAVGTDRPLPYWMRMVMPYASKEFGWAVYPEVGDQVLVMRVGNGEWLCLGSLYTGTNLAKVKNDEGKKYGKNLVKEFRTKMGNAITIGDEDGKEYVTVDVKEGKMSFKMDLGAKAITVVGGDAETVDVTADKAVLTVTCKDATLKAGDAVVEIKSNKIDVKGAKLTVKSDAEITIEGGGKVVIKGSAVEIC